MARRCRRHRRFSREARRDGRAHARLASIAAAPADRGVDDAREPEPVRRDAPEVDGWNRCNGCDRCAASARRSKGWNIADDSYVMADGSGLSRYNYVTSDALVRILGQMRDDPKHASGVRRHTSRGGPRRITLAPARGNRGRRPGESEDWNGRQRSRDCGLRRHGGRRHAGFLDHRDNFTVPTTAIDAAADKALVRLATFSRQP